MHDIKINADTSARGTKVMLGNQEFEGLTGLDIRMRVDEVVSITASIIPNSTALYYKGADVFIVIGDKKYKLMECVGDAECIQEN
jgi:hypothetical protein